ncbi:hypothetical protein E2C00_33205 [Streptomyces sp. WAC05374]|uniref:hypothetical protein n=1 Tax=Streptomyces sp. WAC05374 TaxID=2487420 RepID=UPI000F87CA7E|nr:hypothetical protein [Streptomyces sp. WAC05374]RST16905.1 hypothetical protein EF905_11220 [Streptomyces sp. WAC05374]TDF35324.1 hypothetical protein E2B92_32340 [Streptomyces sp. WAC05374]TDF46270.1 hypothetical protein E2C02_32100 [Streptomyces sp. WAC05374]TDF46908.1 hypothetical protein E2C00_33205 [Streptomyces sp. WAC05374]
MSRSEPPADDVEAMLTIPPQKLRRHPRLLYARRASEAAAKALAYSRGGGGGKRTYDDLAYRYLCACPQVPFVGVETLAGRAERDRRRQRAGLPADLARLAGQRDFLVHRRLAFPDGQFRVGIERGLLYAMAEPGGEIVGRIPLAVRHRALDGLTKPQDVRPQPTMSVWPHLTESRWLPLDELIGYARFPRMREAASRLVHGVFPGRHHVFVSHRWLNVEQPDPDGAQARLVAWHLVASMCEAVRVAHRRGLHTPRHVAPAAMHMPVGVAGSDLAECLLVGVLREVLDETSLLPVAQELEQVGVDAVELGASEASEDIGLERLSALLDTLPALRPLLEHIHIWYDYTCVPQAPRTPEEQEIFRKTLESLFLLQFAGRTLVLLDDVADYLGRAWCSLEAATALAATAGGRPDILHTGGPARPSGPATDAESLRSLVNDRQLVIWRGLLDTEVFRLQSREECVRRLGLSMAEPGDLPYLYDRMLSFAVPNGRMSRQALVTGVVPLPDMGEGKILIPMPDYSGSQPADGGRPVRVIGTLDGWGGLNLRGYIEERQAAGPPDVTPYWSFPDLDATGTRQTCHVAVVAECEGEAVLISSWVRRHRTELEKQLRLTIVSGSWTAVDPVPVGHLPHGRLRAQPVRADVWVVVGKSGLVMNDVGQALCRVVYEARLPAITVSLDHTKENVKQVVGDVAPGAPHSGLLSGWGDGYEHPSGLLYMHLYCHLLQWGASVR